MPKFSEMTGRERWEAALRREKPDRLPMDYRSTGEFTDKLLRHTNCADLDSFCEKYHIDNWLHLAPRYTGPDRADGSDLFGCRFADIDYGTGSYRECVFHPLAEYETIDEIERGYSWPDADLYDYSHIGEEARANAQRPLIAGGWEPFLVYKHLRGEEQGYIDLIENPELCRYIMGKLFDFAYITTERVLGEAGGRVLLSDCSEDLGSQTGLLYSPAQIREFFLPLHKRMIDLQHSHGAKVVWHTDGAARDILPDLVALGIDVLDPIQWRCPGMEREPLMRDFGNRLVFHGGVDNQWTLPFGSAEDVREEVRANFGIFGKYGGYIMGPCHNFQSVGPAENAVAMYETGYNECVY